MAGCRCKLQREPSSSSKKPPEIQLVEPLEPCHDCHLLVPCLKVGAGQYASGYECSGCRTVRWGGVTHYSGPRVLGYVFANNAHICWRCHEAFTPLGYSFPMLDYAQGPMASLTTQSEYKNNAYCDECGCLINTER